MANREVLKITVTERRDGGYNIWREYNGKTEGGGADEATTNEIREFLNGKI